MSDFLSRPNYKIIDVIGSGSFGKVFKILDKDSNKIYALKRIDLNNNQFKENLKSIQTETQILKSIKSEHIVQFHEYFKEGDSFYIVMEFCENKDLRSFINNYKKNNKLIHENVIKVITVELCLGIKEIHSKNIIHRDLKPENIFISDDYKIKIGDFGISKILDGTDYAQTFAGTFCYLAPEIINGNKYTNKADIWSLGCILYELCTLNRCFDSNNILKLINQINSGIHGKIDLNIYNDRWQKMIDLLLKKDYKERPNIEEALELCSRKNTLDEYKKLANNTIDEMGKNIFFSEKDENYKGIPGWFEWIENSLLNKESNGVIYIDVLSKAIILGLDGKLFARYNFPIIKPKEIDNLKQIFQKKTVNKNDSIIINDKKYEIINYTEGFSIEFKSGNEGGTVAKGNLIFIIGIFDENQFCKVNGKEEKQNLKLCKFVVEDCANSIKGYNY